MTTYLLDTNVLIEFLKGKPPAGSAIVRLLDRGAVLASCSVTVAEFYSGEVPGRQPVWDSFIAGLEFWANTFEDAIEAGNYRRDFSRRGIQLSVTDTLVAATARHMGATLLTENLKDFPMTDIQVVSLAEA